MNLKEKIINDITSNQIILYMKGTKEMPMCGFSNSVVQILNHYGVDFQDVNVLDDPPTPPYNCDQWGVNGDDRIPIIVNDYSYNGEVRSWFNFSQWSMPQYIFIDQDFKYHAITQTESIAEDILEELLENLEGE